ncbi:MFS transporter [Streptomyces liangshanensis]|uniref:MFS transporter n=1 Tax=Streptomyces liangshanensis TaxID=2717324 RepID=A0A6G9H1J7_9ACTN|nr:MFS transporter [Streptomyces liangshanensis]QIQ04159.1 MFS transporter [Streptomyces liangshanensis]
MSDQSTPGPPSDSSSNSPSDSPSGRPGDAGTGSSNPTNADPGAKDPAPSDPAPSDPGPTDPGATPVPADEPDPRRWWALAVIATAQLMVVLDATIVNIALPSAQRALHISNGNRQWVITAYTLAFGGLLLLGGRVADLVGRKRTFIIGLIGFAGSSAIGGASTGQEMLFLSRALQGIFAALLAPSALSLLTTTFPTGKERAQAFGIFSAIAGGGSAIGLLLGGILTEWLSWRWCLYVNVPIALLAVIGAFILLKDREGTRNAHLDIPGVILGCGGLVAIVYGFSQAESDGWTSTEVLSVLSVGVALLAAFTWWQTRSPAPLLPLHIIKERNRGGSVLVMALTTIGLFGAFLFLTFFLQNILGYSPIKAGLAFLPLSAGIIIGSTQISARLLPLVAPRLLVVPGLLLSAGGMYSLTFIDTHSSYPAHILPGTILLGFGLGLTFLPVISTATSGVAQSDSGVTSATVNTAQQVGGSIGTSLLNTIAATSTTTYLTAHLAAAAREGGLTPAERANIVNTGTVHGFTVAIAWAAIILLAAAIIGAILINAKSPRSQGASNASDAPGAAV